jgi:tetratricopeptide (TPR) repeat protein
MSEDDKARSNGQPSKESAQTPRPVGSPATRDEIVAGVLNIYGDAAMAAATSDETQLRRLIQALRNRRGRFGLLFAVCNDPTQRKRLSAQVRDKLPDMPPTELTLSGQEHSLLDTLAAAPGRPGPLVVFGLELLLPSSEAGRAHRERTLQEMQLRREQFRSLMRPLLLWMPEYVYTMIGQQAVDFWSWQSGGFFFSGRQTPTQRGERGPVSKLATPPARSVSGERQGRARQYAQLTATLRSGATVVLYGIAGAGKSDLALSALRGMRDEFPDGQLVISLGDSLDSPRSAVDGLRDAIRAYLPDSTLPEDLAVLTALYRGVLGGRRTLILLDDAADAEAVRPFLPPAGSALLVTARDKLALPDAVQIAVDRLLPEESLALLESLVPGLPPDQARRLVELCDHLPLTIRVAGGLLAAEDEPARSLRPLLESLRVARERRLQAGLDTPRAGLEAALQLSYNLLDADSRRVFQLLSVFPASFDAEAAEAICHDEQAALLHGLAARQLVQVEDERFSLHSLVRQFAATAAAGSARADAEAHHALYFARLLDRAEALYRQGHAALRQGLALFDQEWPNIRAGQCWAAGRAEADDEAANLCISYPIRGRRLLELRRPSQERAAWLDAALRAARRLGLDEAETTLLLLLAQERAAQGQLEAAIAATRAALRLCRQSGDERRTALALAELSRLAREAGDYAGAIAAAEEGLAIQRRRADRAGERAALENLGLARRRQGRLDAALEALAQALQVARLAGDTRGEAAALYNLGYTAQMQGDYAAARARFGEALALAEQLGDQAAIARLHAGIGRARARLGDTSGAIHEYAQAIGLARDLGDRALEGSLLANLGAASLAAGTFEAALDAYHQALDIARDLGDRRAEAATLNSLGAAYRSAGDYRHAEQLFHQALEIAEQSGDRERVALALNNLGHGHRSAGDYPAAERAYRQALQVARELGDAQREAAVLHNLGQALLLQNDDIGALDSFRQQQAIAQAAGDRYGQASALRGLGHAYERRGELREAIAAAQASLAMLEAMRHPEAAQVRSELDTLRRRANEL